VAISVIVTPLFNKSCGSILLPVAQSRFNFLAPLGLMLTASADRRFLPGLAAEPERSVTHNDLTI
jgi:hypothetical protein